MDYIVQFQDAEGKGHLRAAHLQDHLAFLRETPEIVRAGPLRDTDTRSDAGGLWHVQAASVAAVHALVRADPFWPTGLRKSFTVLEWTVVHTNPASPSPDTAQSKGNGG